MKTSHLATLLFLAGLSSCGRDDATTSASNATSAPARPTTAAPPTKPAIVPAGQRRVIELDGGIRVEIVAEGEGEVVASGDEVALSLELSYVPNPAEPAAEEKTADEKSDAKSSDAKGSKSKPAVASKSDAEAKEHEADSKKPEDAKPTDEASKPDASQPVAAATDDSAKTAHAEPDAKSEAPTEPSTPATQADSTSAPAVATETTPAVVPAAPSADSTPAVEGTAPAPVALAAALEPVIVVSTKNLGTPIRARVGASSALLPGLSRALVGLRQGTVAEITLQAEAAYGAAGLPSAGIPPVTVLHATVEIREVRR